LNPKAISSKVMPALRRTTWLHRDAFSGRRRYPDCKSDRRCRQRRLRSAL